MTDSTSSPAGVPPAGIFVWARRLILGLLLAFVGPSIWNLIGEARVAEAVPQGGPAAFAVFMNILLSQAMGGFAACLVYVVLLVFVNRRASLLVDSLLFALFAAGLAALPFVLY